MFAVKRKKGNEIDDRKEGQYMNSTLAALQAVLTAIDEVADLLKAAEARSPIASPMHHQ